jgi:heme oxygenase
VDGAVIAALRHATDDALRDFEKLPLARRLSSRDVTLSEYAAWLQAHVAVFSAWAEAYPYSLRRACRCDPAARVEALHLDLAALGESVIREAPLAPPAFDWPGHSPAWWGALYVFEGSRFDARAIAASLRRHLGVCVSGALRFLDPVNGPVAQQAWSTTAQCIERALSPAELPLAIEGALATIAHLHRAVATAIPHGEAAAAA